MTERQVREEERMRDGDRMCEEREWGKKEGEEIGSW